MNSHNRGSIWDVLYVDPVTGPASDLGKIERHSGRAHLLWQPLEARLVLFNARVGYNRGDRGATARSSGLWDAAGEHVCCEAGFEAALLGGSVLFNAAEFFYDWEDLQVSMSWAGRRS